ncbi:hypothetical protein DRJ17_07540, partial [Candidatus Woesearchaeota archaeon]
MKHNIKITLVLLLMFVTTQLIGLYIIHSDPFHIKTEVNGTTEIIKNPSLSWIEPPEIQEQSDFRIYFGSIVFAFIIAVLILFLLTKFKIDFMLRIWFFVVVAIALFITFNTILPKSIYFIIFAVAISLI